MPEAATLNDPRIRLGKIFVDRFTEHQSFVALLRDQDLFDRALFWTFRNRTMSQADWAAKVGVSQGTIGNWERGVTYPGKPYRRRLLSASQDMLEAERKRLSRISEDLGLSIEIDPIETRDQLKSSILNAAITDFDFDKSSQKIVPIPFASDDRFHGNADFEKDKVDLLNSLSESAKMIAAGVDRSANLESDRFVQYFTKYSDATQNNQPNPRFLHRLGETIARRTANDDVRHAVNGWDEEAIDGFNQDHIELMRLYFREALAKAQEVESTPIDEGENAQAAENFFKAADLLEDVSKDDGEQIFDKDIPTLLRDIGREVRDLSEQEIFTVDERRKEILKRRRLTAIKNGSIYIGRVLFFTSLFIVMSPATLGTIGSVASIMGLLDAVAPGSVRNIYENLRKAFPILPRLSSK